MPIITLGRCLPNQGPAAAISDVTAARAVLGCLAFLCISLPPTFCGGRLTAEPWPWLSRARGGGAPPLCPELEGVEPPHSVCCLCTPDQMSSAAYQHTCAMHVCHCSNELCCIPAHLLHVCHGSNASTLWLSCQCIVAYLRTILGFSGVSRPATD